MSSPDVLVIALRHNMNWLLSCQKEIIEAKQLANDKIITPQLGRFICESFTNTDDKENIMKP
jgi:hypothetical protein